MNNNGIKSVSNRRLIFDTLSESIGGQDIHIRLHSDQKFNYYLDNCINEIHKNRFQYQNNLMEMNKNILVKCYKFLQQNMLNVSQHKPTNEHHNNYTNSIGVESDVEILARENRRLYDERKKSRETKDDREEIDFTIKVDDDNRPSVENLLEETIRKRQYEMKSIIDNYNTTPQNLEGEGNKIMNENVKLIIKPVENKDDPQNTIKPILINTENTKRKVPRSTKSVSFSHTKGESKDIDSETDPTLNIMAKLKPLPSASEVTVKEPIVEINNTIRTLYGRIGELAKAVGEMSTEMTQIRWELAQLKKVGAAQAAQAVQAGQAVQAVQAVQAATTTM